MICPLLRLSDNQADENGSTNAYSPNTPTFDFDGKTGIGKLFGRGLGIIIGGFLGAVIGKTPASVNIGRVVGGVVGGYIANGLEGAFGGNKVIKLNSTKMRGYNVVYP